MITALVSGVAGGFAIGLIAGLLIAFWGGQQR